jgi:hypothetical protein
MPIDHEVGWKNGNLISDIAMISCHNSLAHVLSKGACDMDFSDAPQASR